MKMNKCVACCDFCIHVLMETDDSGCVLGHYCKIDDYKQVDAGNECLKFECFCGKTLKVGE